MGIVVTTAVLAALAVVVLGVVLRTGSVGPSTAPRLSPGFAPMLLARAGFPATAHNVAVLHDHLGSAFLDAVRGAVPAEALADLGARCAGARGGVPVAGGSSRSWPQRILDELAAVGAPDVAGLPRRAQDALLATAGTGHGLLGGSVFAPLPVSAAGEVPAPRRAADAARPVSA
ncbi:hypothetical protein LQ327_02840 [Actinomycetospora endophytica]|uniref:Uncharacterized protein n=1 Tax=Actinomycetospora endophytica TaxID=2291215 RepID=A0ABS8P282_9PSEU|nr:hypothetical protein [Actinomycetospora endophytica]MCD2192333.1 hypothetical protein [Actinomycetospora endophytica]